MSNEVEVNAEKKPVLTIEAGPHIHDGALTTRRMMVDVILGLIPLIISAIWVFRGYAVFQMVLSVVAALLAEALYAGMRGRKPTLCDGSAVVTGLILALSLPATAPWYVSVVGSFVAIGIGKAVFGGLGNNIFNPAMVGRAFVMIAFPAALGATAYVSAKSGVDAMTMATPLTEMKMAGHVTPLMPLFLGNVNGSIGETSALAAIIGGIYLCLRRTASWEIPVGSLLAVALFSGIPNLRHPNLEWSALHTICSGALLFGAFFIATDPVTSPLAPKGKLIFGFGFGALVLLIRKMSGYPEGVMFAMLIMNALTPLINRATIPTPVGGPVPERKPA